MTERKTTQNDDDVDAFLATVESERKREDARAVRDLMAEVTGEPATMWGKNIVGFGKYQFRYASGREGEWFKVGFSPRAQNLTLYIMSGFDRYDALMERLGKHTTGKSCLYIKRLEDVDTDVLRQLVSESVSHIESTNESVLDTD